MYVSLCALSLCCAQYLRRLPYSAKVDRGNFDQFDESTLHCQNFLYQYFAILNRTILVPVSIIYGMRTFDVLLLYVTKPIIVLKICYKLLYVIQVVEKIFDK